MWSQAVGPPRGVRLAQRAFDSTSTAHRGRSSSDRGRRGDHVRDPQVGPHGRVCRRPALVDDRALQRMARVHGLWPARERRQARLPGRHRADPVGWGSTRCRRPCGEPDSCPDAVGRFDETRYHGGGSLPRSDFANLLKSSAARSVRAPRVVSELSSKARACSASPARWAATGRL